jgi:hypothetical protein
VKCDWLKFQSTTNITNITDIDNTIGNLTNLINNTLRECCPTNKHTNTQPHIPAHIKTLIQEKKKLWDLYVQNGFFTEHKQAYNSKCTTIKHEIKTHSQTTLNQRITNINHNQNFWGSLNKIKGKTKSKTNPTLQNEQGNLTTDPVHCANLFAEHLQKVHQVHNDLNFNSRCGKSLRLGMAQWTEV